MSEAVSEHVKVCPLAAEVVAKEKALQWLKVVGAAGLTAVLSCMGFFFIQNIALTSAVQEVKTKVDERTSNIYTRELADGFSEYMTRNLATMQLLQQRNLESVQELKVSDVEIKNKISSIEKEMDRLHKNYAKVDK